MRLMALCLMVGLAGCSSGDPISSTVTAHTAGSSTSSPLAIPTSIPYPVGGAVTSTTTTSTTAPGITGLVLEPVDVDVTFPVLVFGSATQSYVVDKAGVIVGLSDGRHVLDIREKVLNDGERGLLGAAFHPLYDDGLLVVHYTDRNGNTVVSGFDVAEGVADPTTERVYLQLDQPAANHNGGMVQFDSTGLLYVGLGDGGGANDRYGNGQNGGSWLGAILRLSVGDLAGYTIPADNPFAATEGIRPEIWAMGLRNPWRFWIDEPAGVMVVGDVGQNQYEEIDVIPLDGGGLNLGWPITEGQHCFEPSSGCDTSGLTRPVVEVSHTDSGSCSITGGIVYRGSAMPEFDGTYFFSDYCAGYLRGFAVDDPGTVTDYTDLVGRRLGPVTSFGRGADGEMYITTSEAVFKVVPTR